MRHVLFLLGLTTVLIGMLLLLMRRAESGAYWLTYDSSAPTVIHRRLRDGSIRNMPLPSAQRIEMWDWSPDGRWLLFTDESAQLRDLFRVHVSGSPIEQLTDMPTRVFNASYSPDGEWIIFSAGENLIWRLYRMSASGGQPQVISQEGVMPHVASWSPDGADDAWIAGFALNNDNHWFLYRIRPDGSDFKVLYESPVTTFNFLAPRPIWSSDGDWIIFRDGSGDGPDAQVSHLYRVRADGSSLQMMTQGEFFDAQPTVVGDDLYFSSNRGGVFNIFRLDPHADAPPQAITTSTDDLGLLNASPDGDWLHVLRYEFSTGSGPFGDYRLVSTDGSRSQRIRAATSPEFRQTNFSPLIDLPFRAWIVSMVGALMMVTSTALRGRILASR